MDRTCYTTYLRLVLSATFFLSLSACSSGTTSSGTTGTNPPTPSRAANLYVMEINSSNAASIAEFPTSASGVAQPSTTVTLPTTCGYANLAVGQDGQIYVLCDTNGSTLEVFVYPANPTATTQPIRTFFSLTLAVANGAIAVDSTGQVYLGTFSVSGSSPNYLSVSIFSSSASGLASPVRTIQTPVLVASGSDLAPITVDANGNVYTVTYSGIGSTPIVTEYGPTASGKATPIHSFNTPPYTEGLSADASGNTYVSVLALPINATSSQIWVYGPTATGTATPTNVITLPTVTGNQAIIGNTVDKYGNIFVGSLYYTPGNYPTGPYTVNYYGFAAGSTGAATPFMQFNNPLQNGYGFGAF